MSRAPGPGERVRLLFVVGNFVAGGAERHLLELWRRLDRTTFEVEIACFVREGQFLLGPGSRVDIKDPSKVAGETKGEGRQRGGRGKAKTDGESRDSAKTGEVRENAKVAEDSRSEARKARRGGTKSDGEARGKGPSRGES